MVWPAATIAPVAVREGACAWPGSPVSSAIRASGSVLSAEASHCKVRFLVGDPASEVTRQREQIEATSLTVSTRIAVTLEQLERLRDVDGIEARFSDRHIALSVFAFDDEMIVTPHLANLAGHESPTFHLWRCQQDGIFDRFTMHVGALWGQGRDVWDATPVAAS